MALRGGNRRNTLPPLDFVRELFNYDPEKGVLLWNRRPDSHFKTPHAAKLWNARYAGTEAGNKLSRPNGEKRYSEVGIRQEGKTKLFAVHRIVWLMCHKEDPGVMEIDHINHDPTDNRISNLRKCSINENSWNSRGQQLRKYDLPKGVYMDRTTIFAQIGCNGKTYRLGTFDTVEEAHQAYCDAAKRLHDEFACYERKGAAST
jgi:HNH endonuclease/AP2 domain